MYYNTQSNDPSQTILANILFIKLVNAGKDISPVVRLTLLNKVLNDAMISMRIARNRREAESFCRICAEVADLKLSDAAKEYINNPGLCNKMDNLVQSALEYSDEVLATSKEFRERVNLFLRETRMNTKKSR